MAKVIEVYEYEQLSPFVSIPLVQVVIVFENQNFLNNRELLYKALKMECLSGIKISVKINERKEEAVIIHDGDAELIKVALYWNNLKSINNGNTIIIDLNQPRW